VVSETFLLLISARRQLNELSDDMATKISILYYADAREALIKALGDWRVISDYGRMRAMLKMGI
jgi:hypothetical protein